MDKLIANNVDIISPPLLAPDSGHKVFMCYDFEGNLVEIVEDKKC